MKKILPFICAALLCAACVACAPQQTPPPAGTAKPVEAENPVNGELSVNFNYARVSSHGTNQFAVWIEDSSGEYVTTLMVTGYTAKNGYKKRATSIPLWVEKSRRADMSSFDVDAISKATPDTGSLVYTWDCRVNGNPVEAGIYRYFVEGTVAYTDNIGRNVVFSGEINLGEAQSSSTAALARADEFTEAQTMISGVGATFNENN